MQRLTCIVFLIGLILAPCLCNASFIEDVKWMALNIYHESRSEPIDGQIMVAITTLNRVKDSRFPNNIKNVVQQKGQFSWFSDGKSDKAQDVVSWNKCVYISILTILACTNMDSSNILYYHNTSVEPYWANKMVFYKQVGNHKFYVD